MNIIGPAVEKDYGRRIRRARFGVTDIQHPGVDLFQWRGGGLGRSGLCPGSLGKAELGYRNRHGGSAEQPTAGMIDDFCLHGRTSGSVAELGDNARMSVGPL